MMQIQPLLKNQIKGQNELLNQLGIIESAVANYHGDQILKNSLHNHKQHQNMIQMQDQYDQSKQYYGNPFLIISQSNQKMNPYQRQIEQMKQEQRYTDVYELPTKTNFFNFNFDLDRSQKSTSNNNVQVNKFSLNAKRQTNKSQIYRFDDSQSNMQKKLYEEQRQKSLSYLSQINNYESQKLKDQNFNNRKSNFMFNSFDINFSNFMFQGLDITKGLKNHVDQSNVSIQPQKEQIQIKSKQVKLDFNQKQKNKIQNLQIEQNNVFNNSFLREQQSFRSQYSSFQSSFIDSFKVQYKKPELFMGAFSHVQNFFNFSDIKVKIPSLQQEPPFSKFFNNEIPISQSKFYENQLILNRSKQQKQNFNEINIQNNQQNVNLYTLQTVNQQYDQQQIKNKANELDIFVQFDLAQSRIQEQNTDQKNNGNYLNQSLLSQYPQLFQAYHSLEQWEYEREKYSGLQPKMVQSQLYDLSQTFQIYHPTSTLIIAQMQYNTNMNNDVQFYLSDNKLIKAIGLMVIGIENPLFKLDYQKKQWYSQIQGLSLQHTLRNSLNIHIQEIFQMANYRSRLEQAVSYIKKNSFRKIYFEVSKQVSNILHALQQIVLELLSNLKEDSSSLNQNNKIQEPFGILEFLTNLKQVHFQIKLVYNLIINEQNVKQQNLSYNDFDYKFLRSQFQIFLTILRLSKQADGLDGNILRNNLIMLQNSSFSNHIISCLVRASFKPIISILNILLFQQIVTISHKDQTYLKYYFESTKQIIANIGKRIKMIKYQSLQLYQICKMKGEMQLVGTNNSEATLMQLQKYEHIWNQIFHQKQKKLQLCLNQMKKQQREKLIQLRNQRIKQIYQLKLKLYQKQEEKSKIKKEQYQKNRLQIEKIKKEIKQKEERKKLQQLIQKERQKGYLLQLELKEKQRLILEKDRLFQLAEQENIKVKQSNYLENKLSLKIQEQKQSQINESLLLKDSSKGSKGYEPLNQPIQQNENILKIQSNNNLQRQQNQDNRQLQMKRKRSPSMIGKIFTLKKFHYQNFQQNFNANSSKAVESSDQQSELSSQNQLGQQEMLQQNQQIKHNYDKLKIGTHVNSSTVFEVCIDRVLTHQTQIINNCMCVLVFQKYHMPSIIKFLRKIFMFGNGQQIQELLNLSVNTSSLMDLKYFSQCFLFDSIEKQIKDLRPQFYHMKQQGIDIIRQRMSKSAIGYYGEIDLINDNLENSIGFQFGKLPNILESFFSYIHLSKYMQIFSFLLRLRHCQNLMASSWKMLNSYKKTIFEKQKIDKINSRYDNQRDPVVEFEVQLMKKLFVTRQIIQNFLTVYQNYIYFRVIEKQFKSLSKKQKENSFSLTQFPVVHLKLLDTIIRFAFIDNSTNNITKDIRKLFEYVRQFYRICERVFVDDVPEYAWQEVQSKVKFIFTAFSKNHKFFQTLYYRN